MKRNYPRHQKTFRTSDISDPNLRKIILRKRKKKMIKRVIIRSSILILIFILALTLIITGIRHLFFSKSNEDEPNLTKGTIFLDPGHGGEDPGAESEGRLEKEDTLKMAMSIKKALNKRGYKVKLSRTTDETVIRSHRGEMANECNAKFMISIHRNKALSGQGIEMWIPSSNGEKDRLLGENIMHALEKVGISQNRGVRSGTLVDPNDDYQENSVSTMPSVLIEFGFISDIEDNKLFDNNLKAYGKAVAKGIEKTDNSIYGSDD